jgi:hypothetical protein
MAENALNLVVHFCLRAAVMVTFCRAQSFPAGHGAKDFGLFRTGLFLRQHEITMDFQGHWRKQKAFPGANI